MKRRQGYWWTLRGLRLRAQIYTLLSVITLIALMNTGLAQLGLAGFGLSLAGLIAAHLLNKPWLVTELPHPGGLARLSRDLGAQVGIALVLFWLGYGASVLSGWSPEFAVGRPAAVILLAGGLRRWIWPPIQMVEERLAPPGQVPDLPPRQASALTRRLQALPATGASRAQILAALEQGRQGLAPDRFALELIDLAAMSGTCRDRMAMVLGLTTAEQARACAGHRDLLQAFDVLSKNTDTESMLSFAVRSVALLETDPDLAPDLPCPMVVRQIAADHPGILVAPMTALALRIEQQQEKSLSL